MKTCRKIAFLVMLVILSTTLNTYAADFADTPDATDIVLSSSATNVKVGENVTITLSAKAAAGIEGVDATLEYDKTKLEFTNPGTLAATGYTSMSDTNDATGTFQLSVLYTGSGNAPTEANFATLTFKVLDAANVNEALSIKLSQVEVGDSNDEWETVVDKELTLTVVENTTEGGEETPGGDDQNPGGEETPGGDDQNPGGEETPGGDDQNPGGEETPGGDDQNPAGEQKPNDKEEVKDDTTAKKPMNNAGLETYGLISIVAIALVAFILYFKNKKYSDVK